MNATRHCDNGAVPETLSLDQVFGLWGDHVVTGSTNSAVSAPNGNGLASRE